MIAKVRQTIEKFGLLKPGQRVAVGFSGGIDSVTLLHLLRGFHEYRMDLWALYVNHGLRPEENRREIALLERYGRELGVQTRVVDIHLPERLREKPQSIQLLAREKRYLAFENFRREHGIDRLALAHHSDDQVETVLFRLIRGTGLDGLAGMPIVRNDFYIRPLLEVSRADIKKYAAEQGLEWVEDSSNQKIVYGRNKIRHHLLPLIETSYNPRFRQGMLRLAGLAREQREYIDEALIAKTQGVIFQDGERVGLKLGAFLENHPYMQYHLLKLVLGQVHPDYSLESPAVLRLRDKIEREKEGFKRTTISRMVSVYCDQTVIYFEGRSDVPQRYGSYPVDSSGVVVIPPLKIGLRIETATEPPDWSEVGQNEAFVNLPQECFPLSVRFWRPGDRFHPLGAPGQQKLHDFFINQKVSRKMRPKVPLLVAADDRIIWVAGYRINDEFKVTSESQDIWRTELVYIQG